MEEISPFHVNLLKYDSLMDDDFVVYDFKRVLLWTNRFNITNIF